MGSSEARGHSTCQLRRERQVWHRKWRLNGAVGGVSSYFSLEYCHLDSKICDKLETLLFPGVSRPWQHSHNQGKWETRANVSGA